MFFFRIFLTLFFILYNCRFILCKSTVEIFPDESFKENQQTQEKVYEHGFICKVIQYDDSLLKYQKMKTATLKAGKPEVYPDKTYFTVEHKKGMYVLDLKLNKNFLSPSYSVTTFSEDGKKETQHVADKEENNCYYQGFVRGSNISKVLVSTCNGLRGVIMLNDDTMNVFRLDNGTHYISKSDSNDDAFNFCETNDDPQRFVRHSNFGFHLQNQVSSQSRSSERIFIELMIVADNIVYNNMGSVQSVESFIKEMVNIINAFYLELDIRVVLKHIEIWNQRNLIPSNTNSSAMLLQFGHYRVSEIEAEGSFSPWATADSIHLLFGDDFDGPTLGIAYLDSICRISAIGLTQIDSAFQSASVLTHELGHVLGMRHITNQCNCPLNQECIMKASTSGSLNRAWSDCSRAVIENARTNGLPLCILNEPDPDKNLAGPYCGNDIVEEGEECDCGTTKTCNSRCCNPATCTFLSNAVCDKELCCNDCKIVSEGVKCREADNECEMTEYCDGSASKCPVNSFKANGVMCSNGHGTCQNGVCYTHDYACKRLWGPDASNGDNLCYQNINLEGMLHGNCGVDRNGNYIKCSPENVFCGKIYCSGGNELPNFRLESYVLSFDNGVECKEIGDNNGLTLQQSLVPNGTGCGLGKVCMNAECVQYTLDSCSTKCNGNGVCDNFDRCICSDGFFPPTCSNNPMEITTTFETTTSTNASSVTKEEINFVPVVNFIKDNYLIFASIGICIVLIVAAMFVLTKRANKSSKEQLISVSEKQYSL